MAANFPLLQFSSHSLQSKVQTKRLKFSNLSTTSIAKLNSCSLESLNSVNYIYLFSVLFLHLFLFFIFFCAGTCRSSVIRCASSNGREPDSIDDGVKNVEKLVEEKRRAELSARIASGEFTVEKTGYDC